MTVSTSANKTNGSGDSMAVITVPVGVTVYTDKDGITREYREENRHANVGELVKIVKRGDGYVDWNVGDVMTVTKTDEIGVVCFDKRYVAFAAEYVVLIPTDVIHHDGKRWRAVKRKALAGETIMITEATDEMLMYYKIGDVTTVLYVGVCNVRTKLANRCAWVGHTAGDGNRYVVLEPIANSEPQQASVVTVEQRLGDLELAHATLRDRVAELESQYATHRVEAEDREYVRTEQPVAKQYTREQVIQMAKDDVVKLKEGEKTYRLSVSTERIPYYCEAEYVIDRKKRKVVCLLKGHITGVVRSRGIAHTAPDDCFNVHIGKAVALRRALGLDVPTYYTKAPQPTEVQVGDVVDTCMPNGRYHLRVLVAEVVKTVGGEIHMRQSVGGFGYTPFEPEYGDRIIDDSHDFGGEPQ